MHTHFTSTLIDLAENRTHTHTLIGNCEPEASINVDAICYQ